MTFIPKKRKYKKCFKGKIFNQIYKNINSSPLAYGNFGLKAIDFGTLSSKAFETIRQTIRKTIKKSGRVLFTTFPQIPVTKKPLEIRMGKGKGNVDRWVCKLQPGFIFCEINTLNRALALKALKSAQYKLPIKTKIICDI